MVARAIWKARLHVGAETVPVKLYSAIQDTGVHFRLLDVADGQPVKQELVDPRTSRPVPSEQVRRGVPVDEGRFVVLNPEELQALAPEPSREIEVGPFVPPAALDPRHYERPYHLGPDGDEQAYFALAQALAHRERLGFARWVMRNHSYRGVLLARDGYLLLYTVRPAAELVDLEPVRPAPERLPDEKELALAQTLLGTLADVFDPAAWHDEQTSRVHELVAAKTEGRTVEPAEAQLALDGRPLLDALAASVAAAREDGRGG